MDMMNRLKSLLHLVLGRSIRRKMMISFVLATAGIMLALGYTIVQQERAFLMQQSASHAEDFAHAVAVSSTSWVIANDVVGLQEVLQSVARVPSLMYAMVLSPDGRVLASTEPEHVGRFVHDPVSQRLIGNSSIEPLVLVDERQLVDAAAPVLAEGRLLGWVRIGLSRDAVTANLHQVVLQSAVVAVIAIAVIVLIALALSRGLVGGLERLVRVANLVHGGRRDVRADVVRTDEVGMLAAEFNNMLDALEFSEKDLALANDRLHENEERWRFALEGSGDGVWDWNVASGEVLYSPRWLELLGFAPGEVGATMDEWKKRLHPEDAEHVLADLQAHLDGRTITYSNEHRMQCVDGSWKWMLERGMVTSRDPEQKPLRMIGTLSDISERKLAGAEISRLAQAVEQSPTGILMTSCEGELEFTNQAYSHITGYDFGQLYGKSLREMLSSELSDEVYEEISMRLRVGKPWNGVLPNRHRNGELRWEQVSTSPIYDEQGKIANFLIIKTDITEQKLVQLKLEQRDAALARANADLTRFAEVSAHHLMEPARRLVSYTQLLRPHLTAQPEIMQDEEVAISLDTIEHSAIRLRILVRDIQLYLASGEPRGELREEDANAALAAVEQRLASQLNALQVKIGAEELPPAVLDRPRLMDLFAVLLDNALHHGQPADSNERLQIAVRGERTDSLSRYFVSDNGPGIPQAYRERVFGIFERLGAVTAESGTGIGLSIARRIVESRGGRIWIESDGLKGTTVVFELPNSRE